MEIPHSTSLLIWTRKQRTSINWLKINIGIILTTALLSAQPASQPPTNTTSSLSTSTESEPSSAFLTGISSPKLEELTLLSDSEVDSPPAKILDPLIFPLQSSSSNLFNDLIYSHNNYSSPLKAERNAYYNIE